MRLVRVVAGETALSPRDGALATRFGTLPGTVGAQPAHPRTTGWRGLNVRHGTFECREALAHVTVELTQLR